MGDNMAMAMAQAVSHCLSLWRPGFAPRSVHVGFVVDKVALGQVLFQVLRFLPSITFHSGSILIYITWKMKNKPTDGYNSETYSHLFDMNNMNMDCNYMLS
jgi:hypothetical protein